LELFNCVMLIFHLESCHSSWLFHLLMNQWMQVTW